MKSTRPALPLFFLLSAVALTGCGYSVSQLVRDDDLRHRILTDCAKMGAKAVSKDSCKKATEAQARVAGKAVSDIFK